MRDREESQPEATSGNTSLRLNTTFSMTFESKLPDGRLFCRMHYDAEMPELSEIGHAAIQKSASDLIARHAEFGIQAAILHNPSLDDRLKEFPL